jgi:hypothetical protein
MVMSDRARRKQKCNTKKNIRRVRAFGYSFRVPDSRSSYISLIHTACDKGGCISIQSDIARVPRGGENGPEGGSFGDAEEAFFVLLAVCWGWGRGVGGSRVDVGGVGVGNASRRGGLRALVARAPLPSVLLTWLPVWGLEEAGCWNGVVVPFMYN